MMMILKSVIWTLEIVYIFLHATVVNHLQSCYIGHSHSLFNLTFTRRAGNLSLATMAEGEATPVVEAKRLVEREEEGMSQSYHEIFDTQVSLCKSGIFKNEEWQISRATALEKQALAQSRVLKKAAVEVG